MVISSGVRNYRRAIRHSSSDTRQLHASRARYARRDAQQRYLVSSTTILDAFNLFLTTSTCTQVWGDGTSYSKDSGEPFRHQILQRR